jgi:hypothetical protein
MGDVSKDTEFSELMNQVRHLGTIRFAMLGVFVALAAGLLALRFGTDEPAAGIVKYGPWLGTSLTVIFGFFEIFASYQYATA